MAAAAACQQAAGSSNLLQAVAFGRLGCGQLALTHTVTHLACYADSSSAEDRCLAYAQAANQMGQRYGYAAAEQVGSG